MGSATTLIKIFDEVIVEVYGKNLQRVCVAADDSVFAGRFIEAGVEAAWCRAFFLERITKRKAQGKAAPDALKWLKDAVPEGWAAFVAAKSQPSSNTSWSGVKPNPIPKAMTPDELQRQNDRLQGYQNGGRA